MSTRRLPGDPDRNALVDRIVRVDQAGEFGARQIYRGQLAVLKGRPSEPVIREMAAQEEEHLAAFDALIRERRVRPTALAPVWRISAFALGAGTALLGEKAAMACTAAVEEVIDRHYADQSEALAAVGGEEDLKALIDRARADEQEHRETALAEGAERAPAYPLLSRAVKLTTRLAIRLSERI